MTATTHYPNDPTQSFSHIFEGWSVWLEPCPETSKDIFDECSHLQRKCGGPARGVYTIIPHCTLLYNIVPPISASSSSSRGSCGSSGEQEQEKAMDLLYEAKQLFQSQRQAMLNKEMQHSSHSLHFFVPTSFHYMHYPKSADHGKGFGCSISMLLLEKSKWLVDLQRAVKQVFPPDERHSGGGSGSDNYSPHMAFVYAPECYGTWLKNYTEKEIPQHLLRPFDAKHLSVWSTRGETKDWYRIAILPVEG